MESFRKLGLSPGIIKIIEESGFSEPSEIQEKTIPLAMAKQDIIGGSATGSGKTLAFGASIIDHSEKGKGIQALILAPTRELAEQVAKVLHKFSRYKDISVTAVYGGVAISPQISALEKTEIVVGTPGRILDHLERRTIDLSKVKTLVLDEADRMLDMGFLPDVQKIIETCPKERQTMLFSATISQDITHIAKHYMKNPKEISVESYVDPTKLTQTYYDVPKNLKFSLLVHLLKGEKSSLVMVFCNTRENTNFIARNLKKAGIDAIAVHGGLTQAKRTQTIGQFHSQKVFVLVCTDVAARGLDIKNISHVYNYDSPKTSKEYIHRVGRTARAGEEGKAISLVSQRDYENFSRVLEDSELKVKQEQLPQVEQVRVSLFDYSESRGGFRDEKRGFRREGDFRKDRTTGNRFGGPRRSNFNRDGRREFSGRSEGRRFGRPSGSQSRGRRDFGGRSEGRSNFRGERRNNFRRDSRGSSRGRSFSRPRSRRY